MKRYIITLSLALSFSTLALAQSTIDSVLAGIERNNTALQAARKQSDADKFANNTGNYLSNPEVEFAYLIANHSDPGNRTDFSIKQSFDFPTSYRYRSQIASMKNCQSEFGYQRTRREILLQAKFICADIVYYNALSAELKRRQNVAETIVQSVQLQFDKGDVSIINLHKAQLNLLNIGANLEATEIERSSLSSQLAALNGGEAVAVPDTALTALVIADFEMWYATAEQSNPVLQWIRQEVAIAEKSESLSRAQSLPKFSAGYMGEYSGDTKYQGLSVGVTIPLWENKNTVRAAKASSLATQATEADARLQFYNSLSALHAKVAKLQVSADDYRANLSELDNTKLLKTALGRGQISLGEYIVENSIYYESFSQLLDMERSLNRAAAELSVYQ